MSFFFEEEKSTNVLLEPKVEAVPNFENVKRREAEELAMRESMARRRGRRSTILTGTGLTSSPELDNKTLLGA